MPGAHPSRLSQALSVLGPRESLGKKAERWRQDCPRPGRAKVHDRTPAGHWQVKRVTSAVQGLHPQTNCSFGLGTERALQLPSFSFLASAFRLPDGESSPKPRNLSLQLCAPFLPRGPRSPGLWPLQEHVPLFLAPCGLASLLVPPWGVRTQTYGCPLCRVPFLPGRGGSGPGPWCPDPARTGLPVPHSQGVGGEGDPAENIPVRRTSLPESHCFLWPFSFLSHKTALGFLASSLLTTQVPGPWPPPVSPEPRSPGPRPICPQTQGGSPP